VSSRFAEIRV